MKIIPTILMFSLMVLSFTQPSISNEKDMKEGSIAVDITGIETKKGQIIFMLFNNEDGFPREVDKAYQKAAVKDFGTSASYTFENLPYGDYAVVVFHDENANDDIDTNFVGFPKEPVGASNMTKMGRPNFGKCTVSLNAPVLKLSLKFIL